MKKFSHISCPKCESILEELFDWRTDYYCKDCDLHWWYVDGLMSYFFGTFSKVLTVPEGTLPVWQELPL